MVAVGAMWDSFLLFPSSVALRFGKTNFVLARRLLPHLRNESRLDKAGKTWYTAFDAEIWRRVNIKESFILMRFFF